MSKSEKKHFRLYAQRHIIGEKNNYLELFDAIQVMDIYDEPVLKKQLKELSYSRYFAVAKRYLFHQILESLDIFYKKKSIAESIKKDLHITKILLKKQLLVSSQKYLKKAQEKIEAHEMWEYMPEALMVEREMINNNQKNSFQTLEESFDKLELGIKKIKEYNQNWYYSHMIIQTHYSKVNLSKKEGGNTLEQYVISLKKQGVPSNIFWQIDYYKALATYYFMIGEILEASQYNQSLLKLFDENPELIVKKKEEYIVVFNNSLIDNNILKNYEMLEQGISKLRKLVVQEQFSSIPNLPRKVFCLTYSLQLNAQITQHKFKEALLLLPKLQKGLLHFDSNIPKNYAVSFDYMMAYIYFMNEQWTESLFYLDQMQNIPHKGVLQEFLWARERLYLLTHWELENYLLLDNLVNNIRRSRARQQKASRIDALLFRAIKQLLKAITQKEINEIYRTLYQKLLVEKEENLSVWNYFDFDYWLTKKIKKQDNF